MARKNPNGANIDPAALLGVAIAGALAATLGSGPYGWISTIIGITLLLVLHAYDTGFDVEKYRHSPGAWYRKLWIGAFGAVWALCFFLAVSVILEYLFGDPSAEELAIEPGFIFIVWLIAAIVVTIIRFRKE